MPIADDELTRAMLANGRISMVTLDTSIFDEKHLQLNSKTLQALARLKSEAVRFVLSDTVYREVLGHLTGAAEDALRSAKKAIGSALVAFGTEQPTRDELIENISGGRSPTEAGGERLNKYLDDARCEVLKDTELVSLSTVFDGYFSGRAPFGKGKMKSEFPDALALHALERTAADRDTGILVVSKDGDWRAYCAESRRLYLILEIERALALIINAPMELRRTIHRWLVENGRAEGKMWRHIAHNVEQVDFSVDASATIGEVTTFAWVGELKSIGWPEEGDLDIIQAEHSDGADFTRVVVSMPLDLAIAVQVDLEFSYWDSVDKESVGMGSRSIEVDQDSTSSGAQARLGRPAQSDRHASFAIRRRAHRLGRDGTDAGACAHVAAARRAGRCAREYSEARTWRARVADARQRVALGRSRRSQATVARPTRASAQR